MDSDFLVDLAACHHSNPGAGVGGMGQSALALNRFMEAGMVLGLGVSFLTWKVGALGIASSGGGL